MINKIAESIKKLCRTCMSAVCEGENPNIRITQCIDEVPLGSKEGKCIMELLQLVQPQIKVEITDDLSKFLCVDCIKKLQVTYKFLETYKEVDQKIHNMLQRAVAVNDSASYLDSYNENNLDDLLIADYIDNSDDYMFDTDAINELDKTLAYEITNLDNEIEKIRKENCQTESEELFENVQSWPVFDEQTLIHEIVDDVKKLEYYENPYSDESGNECNTSENETSTNIPYKAGKTGIKTNTDRKTTTHPKQKNFRKSKGSTKNDMPSESEDDRISCLEFESETLTKLSLEKSKTDIEINCSTVEHDSTKNSKQKVFRKHKQIEENDIPSENEVEFDSLCQEYENEAPERLEADKLNTSPILDQNTTDNSKQEILTKHKDIQKNNIQNNIQLQNKVDNISSKECENETSTESSFDDDDDEIKTPLKQKVSRRRKKVQEFDMPSQNDDGSVPCQECEAVLENKTLWQEHMHERHLIELPKKKYIRKRNTNSSKIFKCEHCGKEFRKLTIYTVHLRIHTGETPFLCVECGKRFRAASTLRCHMQRHRGDKTIECPHCPKKFVCASGLYLHAKTHTKHKPFVCDICGQSFHMAFELRTHNLYHNNIRKFPCEHCDKRFVRAEQQRRHMRTHTGEKPYCCKYCERAFSQSNDYIKHLRQHLGDNVYRCELCPRRFRLARDLRAHFSSHKDDDEETKTRNMDARMEDEKKLQIKLGVNKV